MARADTLPNLCPPAARQPVRPLAALSRLAARFAAAWRASDEIEMNRRLARSGGRLTDSLEREAINDLLYGRWRSLW
jgi:hypothetical protein